MVLADVKKRFDPLNALPTIIKALRRLCFPLLLLTVLLLIAAMAVDENRAEAVRRYTRDALQFYRDSDPAFDFFLNFAGPEGKLNPGLMTAGRGAGRSVPRWVDGC